MTNKKRVIVSLSDRDYEILLSLQDSMFRNFKTKEPVHATKSEVIESLLFFYDNSTILVDK